MHTQKIIYEQRRTQCHLCQAGNVAEMIKKDIRKMTTSSQEGKEKVCLWLRVCRQQYRPVSTGDLFTVWESPSTVILFFDMTYTALSPWSTLCVTHTHTQSYCPHWIPFFLIHLYILLTTVTLSYLISIKTFPFNFLKCNLNVIKTFVPPRIWKNAANGTH